MRIISQAKLGRIIHKPDQSELDGMELVRFGEKGKPKVMPAKEGHIRKIAGLILPDSPRNLSSVSLGLRFALIRKGTATP